MQLVDQEKVQKIYNLLNLSPAAVYYELFLLKGITTKLKLSIIAGCLNDQREIDNNGRDSKNRNRAIKKAGQSLQELVAKIRIKENAIHQLPER